MTPKVVRNRGRDLRVNFPRQDLSSASPVVGVSAVEYRVRTPSTPMPTSFTTLSYAQQSFSVSSASAEGAAYLNLTGSGTVAILGGDHLLIYKASGSGEDQPGNQSFVAVADSYLYPVETARRVTLKEPLPSAVAQGSSVILFTVAIPITNAHASDNGEGVVEIKITTTDNGGNSRIVNFTQPFWIVERIVTPTLTPSSLTMRYPIVAQLRDDNDVDYNEVIEATWQDRVVASLEAKGLAEERIISAGKLESWHAMECVHHLIKQDMSVPRDVVNSWREDTDRARDLVLAGSRFWYDEAQALENGSELQTGATSLPDGARFVRFST